MSQTGTLNAYLHSLVTVRLITLTLFPMAEVSELRCWPTVAPSHHFAPPSPRADVASKPKQRLIRAPSVCSAVNAESATPRPNQCLEGLHPTCPGEHINVRPPGDPPPTLWTAVRSASRPLTPPKPKKHNPRWGSSRSTAGKTWWSHINNWRCSFMCSRLRPASPSTNSQTPWFQLIGLGQTEKAGGVWTAHFLTSRPTVTQRDARYPTFWIHYCSFPAFMSGRKSLQLFKLKGVECMCRVSIHKCQSRFLNGISNQWKGI